MNTNQKKEIITKFLDNKYFAWTIQFLVIASIILYLMEVDLIHSSNSRVGPCFFLWAERIIAFCFTVEFFLRIYLSEDDKYYLTRNRGIIDLLAILPFWVGFFVPTQYLGIVRALRILRLLKFYRYNPIMIAVFEEFRKYGKWVRTLGFITGIFWLLMSCVVHELEKIAQPDKFGTVANSMWYSFISMTTIGYGDMSPVTSGGKIASIFCMIFGLSAMGAFLGLITMVVHNALKADMEKCGLTE